MVNNKNKRQIETDIRGTQRFNVPSQYFGDTAIGDLKDSGDITRAGTAVGELHDFLAGGVGEGASVHIHPAQLIHAAVP